MESTQQQPDTIIFYKSFYKAISNFPEKEQLELYQALFKLAFDNIAVKFPSGSMQESMYLVASPMITANIKNQINGRKGGRPKNLPQPNYEVEEPEEPEITHTGLEKDIDGFITDYKKYKTADFLPTHNEREKIAIILKDLGEYNPEYWVKVFQLAKGGYLINGEVVPCSLTKILCDHNKIFRGEANLQPNKELVEQRKKAKEEKAKKEKEEYIKVADEEREERANARNNIKNSAQAVEFLNTYIKGGVMLRQIASDYKELKEIYPDVALNKEGIYYVES